MTDWTTEAPPAGKPGWIYCSPREYGRYGVGLTGRRDPHAAIATRWAPLPVLDAPGWLDPHVQPPLGKAMFLYQTAAREIRLAYWSVSARPVDAYDFQDCGERVERWHALPSTPKH